MESFLTLRFPSWQEDVHRVTENQSLQQRINSGELWVLQPNKNATLSNDQLSVVKSGGSRASWDCNLLSSVGWTAGVHEWAVRLDSTSDMMIGVAPATTTPCGPNWTSCGFYIGTGSGALFAQDGTWKRPYFPHKCNRKSTVVNVRLDCSNRQLWFGINGEFKDEPAFSNLPANVALHASFDLDAKGTAFTVIQYATCPQLNL